MGLTNWKGGELRKADALTAKNYLHENEIEGLNRIVVMWLDYAEDQARRRKQILVRDWEHKLTSFSDSMIVPFSPTPEKSVRRPQKSRQERVRRVRNTSSCRQGRRRRSRHA